MFCDFYRFLYEYFFDLSLFNPHQKWRHKIWHHEQKKFSKFATFLARYLIGERCHELIKKLNVFLFVNILRKKLRHAKTMYNQHYKNNQAALPLTSYSSQITLWKISINKKNTYKLHILKGLYVQISILVKRKRDSLGVPSRSVAEIEQCAE